MEKRTANERLINALTYVGFIGAFLCAIGYIITVVVFIEGFKAHNTTQNITFAVINGVFGFVVLQCLKFQGVCLAEDEHENKEIVKKYYDSKTKDKKPRTLKYYWATSVIKDLFTKVTTIIATTAGVIYIVIEGSKDFSLILMAVINLMMFFCFGLIAMSKAYKFYNTQQIPYIKQQLQDGITK